MFLSCAMPYLDWLWISPQPDAENHCSPSALQTLLGRQFRHVDISSDGFDAAAFAALSGTLKAGSWLVLVTSCMGRSGRNLMPTRCAAVIALTLLRSCILSSIKRVLTADNDAILWRQNQPFRWRISLPVLTGTPRPAHHNQNNSNSYSSYCDDAAGRGAVKMPAWAR